MDSKISTQDYDLFCSFLEEACGIVLGENKHYLVDSRLSRILKELALGSVGDLINRVKKEPRSNLRERIIDAMTTNETLWFRDNHPYALLKGLIFPELAKQRFSQLRIWSAACSTGQEPYSISMIAQEYLRSKPGSLPNNFQIVATDISPTVLEQAREGSYDDLALSRGLPAERKAKFFSQDGTSWKVKDDIRKRIQFNELNLMKSYTSLGKFNVIFCRNVLIYFSTELKRDILRRLAQSLVPGGYLYVGSTETLTNYTDDFETLRHSGGTVYQLKEGRANSVFSRPTVSNMGVQQR